MTTCWIICLTLCVAVCMVSANSYFASERYECKKEEKEVDCEVNEKPGKCFKREPDNCCFVCYGDGIELPMPSPRGTKCKTSNGRNGECDGLGECKPKPRSFSEDSGC